MYCFVHIGAFPKLFQFCSCLFYHDFVLFYARFPHLNGHIFWMSIFLFTLLLLAVIYCYICLHIIYKSTVLITLIMNSYILQLLITFVLLYLLQHHITCLLFLFLLLLHLLMTTDAHRIYHWLPLVPSVLSVLPSFYPI